ncbi:hypothetical protein ILUMI_19191 [Ignelater luminosus]|uniref:Uncharacterized protein n=1 Tax=Ignelater luminosus TaxID=2038154 RepID=A0A8K0CKN6_IGNLU|nr:hypothetical protein ILUMI_19191 [Ignelater luminosus]
MSDDIRKNWNKKFYGRFPCVLSGKRTDCPDNDYYGLRRELYSLLLLIEELKGTVAVQMIAYSMCLRWAHNSCARIDDDDETVLHITTRSLVLIHWMLNALCIPYKEDPGDRLWLFKYIEELEFQLLEPLLRKRIENKKVLMKLRVLAAESM